MLSWNRCRTFSDCTCIQHKKKTKKNRFVSNKIAASCLRMHAKRQTFGLGTPYVEPVQFVVIHLPCTHL